MPIEYPEQLPGLRVPGFRQLPGRVPGTRPKPSGTTQIDQQWGTAEIQFLPELWRFEREKGEWEPQKTVVRKGSEELPPCPFSLQCFGVPILPFLSQTSRVQA